MLARRYGRSIAGITLIVSALTLPLVALVDAGLSWLWSFAGLGVAGLAYVVARATGAARVEASALAQAGALVDGAGVDPTMHERLRTHEGVATSLAQTLGGAGRSLSWMLVGVSLFLPLFLHALVHRVTEFHAFASREFDHWVLFSAVITALAHGVLAQRAWRYGASLEHTRDAGPAAIRAGFAALGWTVLASTIPGIVLMAIPVLLVALTGLVFVPAAWALAARAARREHAVLDAALTRMRQRASDVVGREIPLEHNAETPVRVTLDAQGPSHDGAPAPSVATAADEDVLEARSAPHEREA